MFILNRFIFCLLYYFIFNKVGSATHRHFLLNFIGLLHFNFSLLNLLSLIFLFCLAIVIRFFWRICIWRRGEWFFFFILIPFKFNSRVIGSNSAYSNIFGEFLLKRWKRCLFDLFFLKFSKAWFNVLI